MIHRKFSLATVLVVTALFTAPCLAQLDSGTISGRIADASGAVIAGAAVNIVNTSTNFEGITQTNADGLYRVPSLRPGPYTVTVKAAGFKTLVRQGVELRVSDNLEVNGTLEIGGTSESISVTGEVSQLQTETSSGGATLEGTYIQQLPLYQRNVKATFYLLPNVDVSGFGYSGNLQGYHIDGLKDSNIGYFQDGVYAVANNNGTIYTSDPIQSTVEEVKILSSAIPAEIGHAGGGAMIAVQKTGTNTLHGEISEFGRVSAMQHRKFFDLYHFGQVQPGQVATPSELFQEPNATLTGPLTIPKIHNGKNKTFFVFAVERLIEKQAKQSAYTVPDAQELMGNFSFAGKGVANPNPIYDPKSTALVNGAWQRTIFPGNIIPTSRLDPVALKFFSLTPFAAPNVPGTYSNTGPSNNFQGTYLKKVFWENYTGRVDQQFTPDFKMYGNWAYNSRFQRSPNPQISNSLFDSSLNTEQDYQNTASLGATKILSPTLINEARIGYYRFEANVASPDANKNLAGTLGIPGIPGTLLPSGLPLSVAGFSENVIETFTVKDDMTWIKNKHSFKFGYDLLHSRQNSYGLGSAGGSNSIFGNTTGQVNNPSGYFVMDQGQAVTPQGAFVPNTGIPLAGFLLGSVNSATFSIPTASWLPRDNINGFYFQDDWKFSPTLTLNLGVRWTAESPWHTKYGQFSEFNPNMPDNLVKGDMGLITNPGGNITKREWQAPEPRVGVAWHPIEKLVVRSGFAMMHVDLGLAPNQLDNYSISVTQSQPSGNPTPIYQLSTGPGAIVYNALSSGGTQIFQGSNLANRNTTYTNPNLKDPYSMTWNLDLQYQLRSNVLMEVSYDGTAGIGNLETPQYNALPENFLAGNTTALAAFVANPQPYRVFPNYGSITYRGNISHSTYHAGTFHMQKRYSHGLTLDGFYTRSKSIDGAGVGNVDVASNLYKGPSAFDRRNRFVSNFTYDLPFGKGRTFMNKGGFMNGVFGGYTLVWAYSIYSGNPITWSVTNSPNISMPSFIGPGGSIGTVPVLLASPSLRDSWQDLGGNRFNQGFQNSTITSLSDFAYAGSYQFGNAGKDTFYTQRQISASFSVRKEFTLKERMKLQVRLDFQNPFKWYNWGNMNTTVDLKNVLNGVETTGNLFGKVSSGNEATSVADGGVPMMNATIKLVW